jgi:opacity protein-like surface antigen
VGRLLGSAGDTVVSANESGGASKLYGGYNLNRLFGREAALATVGATEIAYPNTATGKKTAKTDYSVSALTLAGVARHEFDSGFIVMGKVGVAVTGARNDCVIAQDGPLGTDATVSGETNFCWGLSAGPNFTPRWALMLDHDNFGTAGDDKQTGRAKVQTPVARVQYRA